MRFAIPLLAALAMFTLVACGGTDEDDEATAPVSVPLAQRFVTAEDAPGSKADPDETRQTTEDYDEFIATLNERAIDPDDEEVTAAFEEARLQGGGCRHALLRRDAHTRRFAPCRQFVHRARLRRRGDGCTRLVRIGREEAVPDELRRADKHLRRR